MLPTMLERILRRREAWTRIACLALAVVLGACSGARLLTDGHLAYNEAIRDAADRELLLNIVRLRYLDSLAFLSITSVNSSVSFSVGLPASGGPRWASPRPTPGSARAIRAPPPSPSPPSGAATSAAG